eukprot:364791-Chlamydomonas_euryale.AAC.3
MHAPDDARSMHAPDDARTMHAPGSAHSMHAPDGAHLAYHPQDDDADAFTHDRTLPRSQSARPPPHFDTCSHNQWTANPTNSSSEGWAPSTIATQPACLPASSDFDACRPGWSPPQAQPQPAAAQPAMPLSAPTHQQHDHHRQKLLHQRACDSTRRNLENSPARTSRPHLHECHMPKPSRRNV